MTIRLPEELLKRAKRKAAVEGRTLTALIEDGLRIIVDEKQKKLKLPPVSKATGGFRPGFENMTFSQIQELDDLEYAERLRKGFK